MLDGIFLYCLLDIMEDTKPEEKSPLLLYLVEGEGNVSRNNKRVNFDKGRLYGISSGATAVFTEFPNYISPCWLTALLSSLIFFMMVLLMVSSMESSNRLRTPRCTHSHLEDLDNKTIHLVHDLSNWNEEQLDILEKIKSQYEGYDIRLILLSPGINKRKKISKALPIADMLENSSNMVTAPSVTTPKVNQAIVETKRAKRGKRGIRSLNKRKKRDHGDKSGPLSIGMGVRSLLDILLNSRMDNGIVKRSVHNDTIVTTIPLNLTELLPIPTTQEPQPKTLDDVICNFPGITVKNVTLEEVFAKTALEKNWFKLNKELTIFAVRILHLWQYAGLSFKIDGFGAERSWSDVDDFSVAPELTLRSFQPDSTEHLPSPNADKLLDFINGGKLIYDTLPKDVVTADDEGLHIFTKMPCHVFFGEVLMNLKHARGDETSKFIIQQSLKVFCRHSAVGQNYCRNLVRRAA